MLRESSKTKDTLLYVLSTVQTKDVSKVWTGFLYRACCWPILAVPDDWPCLTIEIYTVGNLTIRDLDFECQQVLVKLYYQLSNPKTSST